MAMTAAGGSAAARPPAGHRQRSSDLVARGTPGAGRDLGWHGRAYLAEALGTFLLVLVGLSVVIFDFGRGSPVAALVPDPLMRRILTGFLFGGVGALVAVSPIGRVSGAHLDPVLSWAFWAVGSLHWKDALLYTVAQTVGAVGAAFLLPGLWGGFGASVLYGATVPGPAGVLAALAGEAVATFCLVAGILWFVAHKRLRPFTPGLIPPLVALLVGFEAPLSGTSMNPARSLGPAIVGHATGFLWIDLLGPAIGAAMAAWAVVSPGRDHVAKVAYHDVDPRGRFRGSSRRSPAARLRRWLKAFFGGGRV